MSKHVCSLWSCSDNSIGAIVSGSPYLVSYFWSKDLISWTIGVSDTLLVFVTILVVYNLLFQITNDIPIVSNFVLNMAALPNTNCNGVVLVHPLLAVVEVHCIEAQVLYSFVV